MKSNLQRIDNVYTFGAVEEGQFYLANAARVIKTVIDGLYSNKIRAPIREYCTNAYDAHIQAGKVHEPFTVQLPTRLDPIFRVRDYGRGLTHREVFEIFTGLGLSTKDDTNEQVGMLGYGAKSAFAYTNTFWIGAYDGKTKRLYDAYIGQDGVPRIKYNGEVPCTAPSGLEIGFAVKLEDVSTFNKEAEFVLMGFDPMPEILGGENFTNPENFEVLEQGKGWKLYVPQPPYYRQEPNRAPIKSLHARQGCVLYPIESNVLGNDTYIERLHRLSLVVDFEIGDLNVSDSRESLGYDRRTIQNIRKRLHEVLEDIQNHIQNKLETEAQTLWEAFCLTKRIRDNNSLVAVLGSQLNWRDKPVPDVIALTMTGPVLGCDISLDRLVRLKSPRFKSEKHIYVRSQNTTFLVEETDKKLYRVNERVKKWANEKKDSFDSSGVYHRHQVVWIKTPNVNDPVYKELMETLGHPPVINLESIDPPKTTRKGGRVRKWNEYSALCTMTGRIVFKTGDPYEYDIYIPTYNKAPVRSWANPKDQLSSSELYTISEFLRSIGFRPSSGLVPLIHYGERNNVKDARSLIDIFEEEFDKNWNPQEVADSLAYHDVMKSPVVQLLMEHRIPLPGSLPKPSLPYGQAVLFMQALQVRDRSSSTKQLEKLERGSIYRKTFRKWLDEYPILEFLDSMNPYKLTDTAAKVVRHYLNQSEKK